MTDLATNTVADTGANQPAVHSVISDEKTPEERAYFESRGTKTDGLIPGARPAPAAKVEPAPNAEPNGEDVDTEADVAEGVGRDPKTGQFVSRSAYLRVKEEAKEAKAERGRYSDELIRARERLAILSEVLPKGDAPKADAQADTDIDPNEDIFGAFEQMRRRMQGLQQGFRTSSEMQATKDYFNSDVSSFTSKNPDFNDALAHAAKTWDAILEASGNADPSQRKATIAREINSIIQTARTQKGSAAKSLYEMAKAMGYSAKPPAPAPEAAQKAAEEAARAEIAALERGQAASQSLRGVGTGGTPELLNRAKIADMSDDEFRAARKAHTDKHGLASWQKLVYGG